MNFKRILALVLAAIMVLGMTACSGSGTADNAGSNAPAATESAATESAATQTGEKPVIKISYPVLVAVPTEEGTVNVEKAMNAYLDEQNKPFHIDLEPIDGMNYANTIDMALLGSTPMDIICPFSGLSQAITSNKVIPLNPYLDNELKETVDLMGKDFLTYSTVDGNTYAIPAYKGMVLYYYWIVRKDAADAAGIDPNATYNLAQISEAMAKLQTFDPSIPAFAVRAGAGGTGNYAALNYVLGSPEYYAYTTLTAGPACFGDDTTLVNYYASDMYKEYVETAYAWNQAGYIQPDASIETEDGPALMSADRALSYFIGYAYDRPTIEAQSANSGGHPIYAIPVGKDVFTSSSFISWCIAHNSANPELAAQALNMLYTDETFLNLLIFGVEGEDYVTLDTTGVVDAIDWPEGKDMMTVPYTAALSCGILGNQFIMSAMKGSTEVSDVPFMKENIENAKKSPLFGFSFDTTNVANQVSAVTNVINQYNPGLTCGELDPAVYLPKFLEDLEAAGINDIIAEAQKQVDEWKK